MAFSVNWHTLLDELDDLTEDATLITPLLHDRFRIDDVQEQRVIITFEETDERRPLQRDQFETLYRRVTDTWAPGSGTPSRSHKHTKQITQTAHKQPSTAQRSI